MSIFDRMGQMRAPNCVALTILDFYTGELFSLDNLNSLYDAHLRYKLDINSLAEMVDISDNLVAEVSS